MDKGTAHTLETREACAIASRKYWATSPRRRTIEHKRATKIRCNDAYYARHPDRRLAGHLKQYDITPAEYYAKLEEQGGGCGICGRKDSGCPRKKRFAVDHDHVTKRFRGVLCHPCNVGLGYFRDSILLLDRAISYLGKAA